MPAVTSITKRGLIGSPAFEKKAYFYTYTKANATDTLDVSGEFSAVNIVLAVTAVGTVDTGASYSAGTVTFSSGTGTGSCIVVGDA